MFFTGEKEKQKTKNDTPNQNRKHDVFFHVWEKWYVQSKATEVCEFRAKFPAFYRRLHRTAPSLCELFSETGLE